MNTLLFHLAVLFILTDVVAPGGCKSKNNDKPKQVNEQPAQPSAPVQPGTPTSVWPIVEAWIEGDVMHLTVEYMGCKKRPEDFSLFWDGTLLKSNPPGMYVSLKDKKGPQSSCKMIVEDELTFDLKALNYPKPSVIMIDKFSLKYGNE